MDKLREKHRNKAVVSGLDFNLAVLSQVWGSSNTAFSDGILSYSAMNLKKRTLRGYLLLS